MSSRNILHLGYRLCSSRKRQSWFVEFAAAETTSRRRTSNADECDEGEKEKKEKRLQRETFQLDFKMSVPLLCSNFKDLSQIQTLQIIWGFQGLQTSLKERRESCLEPWTVLFKCMQSWIINPNPLYFFLSLWMTEMYSAVSLFK